MNSVTEKYKQRDRYGIDFIELLMALRERAGRILIVTVLTAAFGWGASSFLMTPKYDASINMIVNTQTGALRSVTNDSISSAKNIVDTYAIIIKSNTVLNKVIDNLKLDMTYAELYRQISVNAVNSTQIMKISVRNSDRTLAMKIVEDISATAPEIITDAVEAGSCKVISQVEANEKPVSPDIVQNTVVSGMLGLLIYTGVVVVRVFLNDYIIDDIDIEEKLGMPVLGIVPDAEGK